ncbi:MAG: SRPBCC domain-containing protein [Humibacillus sp.]
MTTDETTGHVARAEVTIDADRATVWSALTKPAELKKWMFGTELHTDWSVGSPVTWSGEMDDKPYEDKGEVLVVDEPEHLAMTHYSPLSGADDVPESYHRLDYRLAELDGSTVVTLDQDGNDSAEQAEQFSGTWQQMLDSLKQTVEGS